MPGSLAYKCGSSDGTSSGMSGNNFKVTRSPDGASASCLVSGVDLAPDQYGNIYPMFHDGYITCASGAKCSVNYKVTIRCSSGKQSDWDSVGRKILTRPL